MNGYILAYWADLGVVIVIMATVLIMRRRGNRTK